MKNKIFTKSLCGALAGLLMAGSMVTPVFADPTDPQTQTNPNSMTIPVTANVDSTYTISVPADMFGNGGDSIALTREFNDKVKTSGDTANAFYGGSFIEATGTIGSTKKLEAKLTCTDLKTADATPLVSAVGIRSITAEQNETAKKIWNKTATDSDKLNFDTSWNAAASTGLTFEFTGTISASGTGNSQSIRYYMLRTVPEKDGDYSGTLTVNFGLKANS